jgi:hypothetical protein
LKVKDPLVEMETPLIPLGAFPFAVAAVTLNPAASCVMLLRSRFIVCPFGTAIESGEPEDNAPVVGLKERVCVASGPDE